MSDGELESLIARARELGEVAGGRIAAAADLPALENERVAWLGKKGEMAGLMRRLGSLTPDQRPQAGQVINEVKEAISGRIDRRRAEFEKAERSRRLVGEKLDITLPGRPHPRGRLHPLTQAVRDIVGILRDIGFDEVRGPDLEDEFHNFEALNIPADHPARDMQDTFYLAGGGLLRTHTSPVQIRAMKGRKPPLAVVAPGRVYRCDADQTHSPMFTQVEGFMVAEDIRMSDLKGVLELLLQRFFGKDRPYRMRPSFFPFTEPSAEFDILWEKDDGSTSWLEVLGSGMIHPAVLEAVGYDPQKYTGFAFGLGVERFAMLRSGVDNIHAFYENDQRFLRQF
ncbi:phenylalanine--tRNA ligase subunit alpha [bacterium]|nr:phenylalanine--tRNA ligase subunit alpha [bacterium]